MKVLSKVYVFLLVLVCLPSWSAELVQPYRVERTVTDQNPETRNRAARGALRELLQRLSGQVMSADHPSLGRAANLVQSFGFREPTPEERVLDTGLYVLQLDFEPKAVTRLLTEAGLPQWGRERPRTLFWLTQAGPDKPVEFVGESGETLLLARLRRDAQRRGLPLVLPKNDAVDLAALSPAELEPLATERIMAASARYEADAILVGTVVPGPSGWNGRFSLIQGEAPLSWETHGPGVEAVLAQALDGLGERLAQQYAVAAGGSDGGPIVLRVSNVQTLSDYGQLLRYLQSLSLVRQVAVTGVEGSVLELSVGVQGDATALRQLLGLGAKLQPVLGTADEGGVLQYQWVP